MKRFPDEDLESSGGKKEKLSPDDQESSDRSRDDDMESSNDEESGYEVSDLDLECWSDLPSSEVSLFHTPSVENCKILDEKMCNIVWSDSGVLKGLKYSKSVHLSYGSIEVTVGRCITTWTLELDCEFSGDGLYKVVPRIMCDKDNDYELMVDGELFTLDDHRNKHSEGKFGNNTKLTSECKHKVFTISGWSAQLEDMPHDNIVSCDLVLKVITRQTDLESNRVPVTEGQQPEGKLAGRMQHILENASSCFNDVNIVCGDGNLPCHAAIIASGSSYFEEKLEELAKEQCISITEINMNDLSMERCRALLEFIYTNKIDPAKINLQLMQDSVTYGVHDLKQYCSPHLARNLDSDNCLDTLVLADKLADADLKTAAQKFILRNSVDTKKLVAHGHLLYELLSETQSSQK